MTTTILRFEKHKHYANIRQAGTHQYRQHISTPNADKCRTHLNKTFIGSSNLLIDVKSRLDTLIKPPRKNAVLAMDGMLTLSPEQFASGDKTERLNTLKKFTVASRLWLKETFGENIVNAVLHLDESSPHIHFTVVPIVTTANGRRSLNARDLFNKVTLHQYQRDYFVAMHQHFPELTTPKYGSKAKHTTIKAFYHSLNQIEQEIQSHLGRALQEQQAGLKQKIDDKVNKHLDEWLTQIFSNVSSNEKQKWIDDIRQKLETKLNDVLLKPSHSSTTKAIKQRALHDLFNK